jgi:hypothetical protein
MAHIGLLGRRINLGEYEDKEMAIVARRAAQKVLGYTNRHGT